MYKIGTAKEAKSLIGKIPKRVCLGTFGVNDMYGMIADLPNGTSAKSVSPARPNTAFDAFVMSLVRQIGNALGIPAEVLFLNFESSYSASRGALLEAWKLFNYWRNWWVTNFCQPVYEEWLQEAVLKGRVNAPGFFDDSMIRYAYSWADWTGPSQLIVPVSELEDMRQKIDRPGTNEARLFYTVQTEAEKFNNEYRKK